jgi:putative addiction module component (TIGR02574 family)
MQTLNQIEGSAMNLPDQQRAKLALHLLESLPAVLQEDDEGLAEAMRRDAELEADPSSGMTMEQFKKAVGR